VFGSSQQDMIECHQHVMPWGENSTRTFGQTATGGKLGINTSQDSDNRWWYTNDGTNFDGVLNPAGVIGCETRPINVAMLPCIKYEVTIAPQVPTSGIPCACITGKGAIVIGDGANSPTALPVGTNGQVLFANSNCTQGAEWAFPPGTNYQQCVAGVTTVFGNATTQVAAISITTVGNPVQISAYGDVYGSNGSASYLGRYFIRRCGTPNVDFRAGWYESANGNVNVPMALTYIDNPPPGTYCYALMVANGGNTVVVGETGGPVLNAYEMGSACFPDAIPCTCIVGKGSLVTGTALNAPTALPVGTCGQILVPNPACATGLQWSNNGKMATGFVSDVSVAGQWVEVDGIQFGMWSGACRSFVMRPASGTMTASWGTCVLTPSITTASGAIYQDIAISSPNWRYLGVNYHFPAHGSVQQATICVAGSGGFTRAMYQFCGIVGFGYIANGISVTRIA
jgi:hypothetical protein